MSKIIPFALGAIAALFLGAATRARADDADEALRRFVAHPTDCAQLFGGPAYGDSVTEQWSRDLAEAMPGGLADAPREIGRVIAACQAELKTRAEGSKDEERAAKASR